jgi:plastocyanin
VHRTAAALGLSGLLLLTGCSTSGSSTHAATPPGATVRIAFTLFQDTAVSIKAGQAVTFVNQNPIGHVIVEGSWTADPGTGLRTAEHDDGAFSLKLAAPGQRVSHVFATPGTYQFFCTIHKGMNGTVTVT